MHDSRSEKTRLEKVVLSWANTFTNGGVPSEAEIRSTLLAMHPIVAASLTNEDLDDVFDEVCRIVNIHMDLGAVIEGAKHAPWLERRRSTIDWRLWGAYAQYLADSGRPPLVIDRLNQSLDIILDHIGDPEDPNSWERRGLVIGDVQSGKTSTYIGLMDKAADAGYQIFIVLTGNTESLRRQTQDRVDEGMIGRDSAAALLGAKNGGGGENNRIGVGLKLESNSAVASTTTVLTDFRKSAAEAMNIEPGKGLSIVFITKKNKVVLDRIADWLESQKAPGSKLKHPILFLDDEADYASINTNKDEEKPTAINEAIRRILATSHRNSYVGFTATPFANIFINDEDDKDLFPRDFIYALDAPSNYIGAGSIFGRSDDGTDNEDNDGPSLPKSLRVLADAEEYFPSKHKSTHSLDDGIPESLSESLRTFLIANAIRDLRGEQDKPRSMLINVSRFNAVQAGLGELVASELAAYRNAIRSHAVTFAYGTPNAELEALSQTFQAEYGGLGFTWPEVLEALPEAVIDIHLRVVNSKRDKEIEQRELRDETPLRQISIGGDLLSRGLTLDGLIVSYFYRRTAASDTLMQMGRWFGYRDGYADLFRIWLAAETISDYAYTADALAELRLELERMRDQKLTPQQYGLAVRNHPGALLITARNKMRAATEGQKSISLRGRQIESASLSSDVERNAANMEAAGTLLSAMEIEGISNEPLSGARQIWRNVPKRMVADFLRGFSASDSAALFSRGALATFALTAQADDLQTWDVVLVGGRGKEINVGPHAANRPIRRVTKDDGTWLISGARRRVAGPGDISAPLSQERAKSIEAAYLADEDHKGKRAPDRDYVRFLDRPVLMLYPVQGTIVDDKDGTQQEVDETLLSVVIGVPGLAGVSNGEDEVKYTINAVAKKLWFAEFETYGDDDDND